VRSFCTPPGSRLGFLGSRRLLFLLSFHGKLAADMEIRAHRHNDTYEKSQCGRENQKRVKVMAPFDLLSDIQVQRKRYGVSKGGQILVDEQCDETHD